MKKLNKKEIKSYSNEILKACKLWGYDYTEEAFECFFDDVSCFYFIPSYKKAIESFADEEDMEEYLESFGEIVDEILEEASNSDTEVKLSLEEIKAFADKNYNSLGEYIAEKKDLDAETVIDWFFECCDKEIKEKFLNWAFE